MKEILLLLLLGFSLNMDAQKMKPEMHEYADGVEYSVVRVIRNKFTQYGNGDDHRMYIAEKGKRFISVAMEFSSKSDKDEIIDFTQIFLIDKDGKRYKVESVLQNKKLSTTVEKFEMVLKAGKTRTYLIDFWASLPKDEPIQRMNVDGIDITFEPED
ncbi:hypothetical protein HUK80_04815 [Flavobacterium sp. MAH-1]|uniref:Uncharacterized protein n=1 Tax=Flavobacterium agri TaxID=2743471 RepID=A0A7Y9C6D3_9FLAO|nr:hypothetical protein [Flavobacterium agri]NUY80208.1 hypothetical protein [Flavobacterium agri]NYA70233.1 hypothetical protein [Flavobacterium agri]